MWCLLYEPAILLPVYYLAVWTHAFSFANVNCPNVFSTNMLSIFNYLPSAYLLHRSVWACLSFHIFSSAWKWNMHFEKLPGSTDEQMHANTAVGWPITHMSNNYISVQGQLEGKLDPLDIQLSKQAWGRMEDVLVWLKYS